MAKGLAIGVAIFGVVAGAIGIFVAFFPSGLSLEKTTFASFSKPVHDNVGINELLTFLYSHDGEVVLLNTSICAKGYEPPVRVMYRHAEGDKSSELEIQRADDNDPEFWPSCYEEELQRGISNGYDGAEDMLAACGGTVRYFYGAAWNNRGDCSGQNHQYFLEGYFSIPSLDRCAYQGGVSDCIIAPATSEGIATFEALLKSKK